MAKLKLSRDKRVDGTVNYYIRVPGHKWWVSPFFEYKEDAMCVTRFTFRLEPPLEAFYVHMGRIILGHLRVIVKKNAWRFTCPYAISQGKFAIDREAI